jgi:regulator of sirC expression with transglutaminase-like and TPR domain
MEETREISALFHLIDDPDDEVFSTVSNRIISFGKGIIPNLENLWENSPDEDVQGRIEMLIHRLQLRDLQHDFDRWKNLPEPDLLAGAMLVAKYQYPDLTPTPLIDEIEKMRRNIWLEMNSYLTPLEQTNVITTILYNYYKIKGTEVNAAEPNDFLFNKLLETKKGNSLNTGILFLILCDLLDVPVRAVDIPKQFILAYFDVSQGKWDKLPSNPSHRIQFYIDPMSGQIFTQKDVETYFRRISVPPTAAYYRPLSNLRIIQHLMESYATCFDNPKNQYKADDLRSLAQSLEI